MSRVAYAPFYSPLTSLATRTILQKRIMMINATYSILLNYKEKNTLENSFYELFLMAFLCDILRKARFDIDLRLAIKGIRHTKGIDYCFVVDRGFCLSIPL